MTFRKTATETLKCYNPRKCWVFAILNRYKWLPTRYICLQGRYNCMQTRYKRLAGCQESVAGGAELQKTAELLGFCDFGPLTKAAGLLTFAARLLRARARLLTMRSLLHKVSFAQPTPRSFILIQLSKSGASALASFSAVQPRRGEWVLQYRVPRGTRY